MKLLIAFALVCVAVAAAKPYQVADKLDLELNKAWETYKLHHGKKYQTAEENTRRLIWEQNLRVIREHNLAYDRGQHTFSLGENQYADWTPEEFVKFFNGYRGQSKTNGTKFLAASNIKAPDSVDWRDQGYVTPVKNQGQCGSCWAFSTTGSLEGQHFKATQKLVSLSEQNLVDCAGGRFMNQGCQGGLMDNAFRYIKANHGIDTEQSYPYEARNGHCKFNAANVGATVTGFTDIPQGDEDALMKASASIGPISVAIDASHPSFQLYRQGVYNERKCSSTRLDHGVLVVGYGSDNGQDYWLVKNSWGESWGMNGYIKMSRNRNNQCGIATQASYPLV